MGLFHIFIFVLIPLLAASQGRPSYRSTVMEGKKPILRMAEEGSSWSSVESRASGSDVSKEELYEDLTRYHDNVRSSGQEQIQYLRKDPALVRDLSILVNWLVENFGYDVIVQGRRNKELEEPIKPAILEDPRGKQKAREGNLSPSPPSDQNRRPPKRLGMMRSHTKKNDYKRSDDPSWVKDLKAFIQDLITRFGQDNLMKFTRPVIDSLEKKHKIQINDIDVDQYGEVFVSYVDKKQAMRTHRVKLKSTNKPRKKIKRSHLRTAPEMIKTPQLDPMAADDDGYQFYQK